MDFTLSFIAGFISFAFFIELLNKSIKSKRPSIIFWMVAIGMYSFATLALAVGLYSGWTPFSFAVFYFFGGITNVPAFGLGSCLLYTSPSPRD